MIDIKRQEEAFEKLSLNQEYEYLSQMTSKITKGTTPKINSTTGEVNFVKVETIENGNILMNKMDLIPINTHEKELKRSILAAEDILYSIAGTLGRTALINEEILPANTNQALSIIRGYNRNSKYLLNYFKSNNHKKWIYKMVSVGAQPNLNLDQVGQIKVPVKSKEIESKIANFLTSLDSLIQKQEEYIEKLKVQKKGYSQKIFSQKSLVLKNSGLNTIKLSDVFEVSNIGADKKSKDNETKVSLLNYMDVYNRSLHTNMVVTVPDEKIEKISVRKNDIFVTPSSETANDIAHFWGIKDSLNNHVYSYHIMRLRPKEEISVDYYEEYLNSALCRNKLMKLAQGAQRYTLSVNNLKSIELQRLDYKKQKKIGNFLNSIDTKIKLQEKKLEQLKLKKKYYLNAIFR